MLNFAYFDEGEENEKLTKYMELYEITPIEDNSQMRMVY